MVTLLVPLQPGRAYSKAVWHDVTMSGIAFTMLVPSWSPLPHSFP